MDRTYVDIRVDDPIGEFLHNFLADIADVFQNGDVRVYLQVVLRFLVHTLKYLLRYCQCNFIGVYRISDQRRDFVQIVKRRVVFRKLFQ